MKVSIRHLTQYDYTPAASRAALRLRLFPPTFQGQTPLHWAVSVNGQPLAPSHTGAFGDAEAVWSTREPQSALTIIAEGEVEVADKAGIVRGLHDCSRPGVFLRPSPLTAPDKAIADLAESARSGATLQTLHTLCDVVADRVSYRPNETHAETTAGEALAHGFGVCQDHAHVFIAAARALGIPARYVAGYMAAAQDLHETHGWAEAYVADLAAWVGFDPANRRCPTEVYVRLSCGADAAGAAPVRGLVAPGSAEALTAKVDIAPLGGQEQ
jgi:transglutaminase-like putative cysteine protease